MENISGILSVIKTGAGFVNPIAKGIDSTIKSFVMPTLAELENLSNAQSIILGVAAPATAQLNTVLTSITNAYNSMQNLLDHTDRLSGINLSGNGSLATIAKTMQLAKKSSGESSCSSVLSAFGSIQKASELVSSTISTIDNIENFLEDIPNKIDGIVSDMENYANDVVHQIESDVEALAQAQLNLVQEAIANNLTSLFDDECVGQVLSSVMTQPMKNEVTKVSDAIKAKKLIKF